VAESRAGRRALIVTGEASGDLHGANLIRAARGIDPELSFFGIGGRRMAEAGCDILFPGEDLAVVGLVEVVGHLPQIYKVFKALKAILRGGSPPDVLVLIDFPEFNLRLARQAQRAGVPVLYYVSPQVWAWRRGRVRKIAHVVDRLAAIFPFEPDFYRGHDIEVEYVGHPLLDEMRVTRARDLFLRDLGLNPEQPVVGLFPGSRRNEIRYIFETILETADLLRSKRPEVQFLLPVAPSLDPEFFHGRIAERGLPVVLVQDGIYDTANACDAVITVSGTVTLQLALVGTPMAILYQMAPLTYAVGRRLIRVPYIGLANIVAEEKVVREFIQDQATPPDVAGEILRILDEPDYERQIRSGLARVREKLGEGGGSLRVARMVSEMAGGHG
jgi:lipid-A-disaccharide synthase